MIENSEAAEAEPAKKTRKRNENAKLHNDAQLKAFKLKDDEPWRIHIDSAIPALKLHVGKQGKTFRLIKFSRGQPYDITIGHHPKMTLTQARKKANEILAEIEAGTYGVKTPWSDLTLADAYALACEGHKRKATDSFHKSVWKWRLRDKFGHRNFVEFAGANEEVRLWHKHLTETATKSNADAMLKTLGMIYERVVERFPELLQEEAIFRNSRASRSLRRLSYGPGVRVIRHGDKVREFDLSREALREHLQAVRLCNDPVRVAFTRWIYFTGMRPRSVFEMRWDWVTSEGIMVPAEAMKMDRPYFCPIAEPTRLILDEMRQFESSYVFPSLMTNKRLGRYLIDDAWTGQRLRKHFATEGVGVANPVLVETLMAHVLNKISPTMSIYVQPTPAALAEAATMIQNHLANLEQEEFDGITE